MTIPYLMNCPHKGGSWCLGCVEEEWKRTQKVEDERDHLRECNEDLQHLHGLQDLEIGRLRAENDRLRRDVASCRGCLRMTSTEVERRLTADRDRLEAERVRYREIARQYLEAFDRVVESQRAISRDELDAVTPQQWSDHHAACDDCDARRADLRASVAKEDA